MQFKAVLVIVAALIVGVLASPVPADIPCKRSVHMLLGRHAVADRLYRARLENRQEPCCCG